MKIMIVWGEKQCLVDRSFTEPRIWRQLVVPKCWYPCIRPHDVRYKNAAIGLFTLTATMTLNPSVPKKLD